MKLYCLQQHFLAEIDVQGDFVLRIPCSRCKASCVVTYAAGKLRARLLPSQPKIRQRIPVPAMQPKP